MVCVNRYAALMELMDLLKADQNSRHFIALLWLVAIFSITMTVNAWAENGADNNGADNNSADNNSADNNSADNNSADNSAAAPSPGQLLKRMSDAFKALNYEGRFFYLNGNNVRSVRIAHGVFDGIEKERLVHLDGPPSEIIRNGKDIICIHEGEAIDRLEQSMSARSLSQRFAGQELLEFYEAQFVGADRIAGREAQRLQLRPKDRNRYGYVLWIDKESGLLLKSVLLSQVGKPLEIFQYSLLVVGGDIDPAQFQAPVVLVPSVSKGAEVRDDVSKKWQVNWLPRGYARSKANINRISSNEDTIQTLMYSDGLSAFTLFFEPSNVDEPLPPNTRKGATVAISRRVDSSKPSFLITIVGELPEAAAQHILSSIQQTSEALGND